MVDGREGGEAGQDREQDEVDELRQVAPGQRRDDNGGADVADKGEDEDGERGGRDLDAERAPDRDVRAQRQRRQQGDVGPDKAGADRAHAQKGQQVDDDGRDDALDADRARVDAGQPGRAEDAGPEVVHDRARRRVVAQGQHEHDVDALQHQARRQHAAEAHAHPRAARGLVRRRHRPPKLPHVRPRRAHRVHKCERHCHLSGLERRAGDGLCRPGARASIGPPAGRRRAVSGASTAAERARRRSGARPWPSSSVGDVSLAQEAWAARMCDPPALDPRHRFAFDPSTAREQRNAHVYDVSYSLQNTVEDAVEGSKQGGRVRHKRRRNSSDNATRTRTGRQSSGRPERPATARAQRVDRSGGLL